ncbi:hypothetical protein EJ02DRAFT_439721 [Clathrospora elynae]|uniref:Uncharacterized protein n=1 Tax=Clathrospora elynae TaxID=706981 RepID=A0A6A5S5B7_9PLEO|nr:hypothetical protein EJ02DRAFT_439721 [Clathrospora elynae]
MDTDKAILNLRQKGQGGKIKLVDIKASDCAQQYTEQRACRAYIASTCQPEASFDLSIAAQAQQPSNEDINALNKHLRWQMENLDRGLCYVPVNLVDDAKLMIFVDGSFANNSNHSSQLGFILMLVNESTNADSTFTIRGNVIHYSSTKCKRVTQSVLASEIYGMVKGFDIGIAIATTLRIITEICWINGNNNPADAFTKASPNRALERFIDSNELTVQIEGWVQRPTISSQ